MRIGIECAAATFAVLRSIVRHGGKICLLREKQIAQSIRCGQLVRRSNTQVIVQRAQFLTSFFQAQRNLRTVSDRAAAATHTKLRCCLDCLEIALAAQNLRRKVVCPCQRIPCSRIKALRQCTGAATADILRCAAAAHLPGVQRRAAGPAHAVRPGRLTRSEQALDIRLPPAVHRKPAVIVLCTKRDLQRLRLQIDAMLAVKLHCGRVHVPQPFDRRAEACACARQILPCLHVEL